MPEKTELQAAKERMCCECKYLGEPVRYGRHRCRIAPGKCVWASDVACGRFAEDPASASQP